MTERVRLPQRVLWWLMVRAERVAQWARWRWLRRHETGGVVLPAGGYEAPRVRRSWFVVHPAALPSELDRFACGKCGAEVPTENGSVDSLPERCPACRYEGEPWR